MKRQNKIEKLLKLWKARQTAEGYDVSGVKTLEDAERFFSEKRRAEKRSGNRDAETPSGSLKKAVEQTATESSSDGNDNARQSQGEAESSLSVSVGEEG